MNNPTSPSPQEMENRAIEEKAAEWFGRFEIGLKPAEDREFMLWLEADPRHGEAMRDMDETWECLDGLKKIPRLRAVPPAPSTNRRVVWLAPSLLAAAAAVAVIFFAFGQVRRTPDVREYTVTETGGMKKIELLDGSTVHLNESSSVLVRFSSTERRLELQRGEAHFDVAKDSARPFVVLAGDVAIKAIGTAFNVRRAARGVEVFVTEGRVRLDDADRGGSLLPRPPAAGVGDASAQPGPSTAETEMLVAGQRALVSLAPTEKPDAEPVPTTRVAAIAPLEIRQALAWQARMLEFDQMPLAQVVEEFNRFNSHQIVIADSDLARKPFGGSFRADSHALFVQLLEERFGVVAESEQDRTILRRGRR